MSLVSICHIAIHVKTWYFVQISLAINEKNGISVFFFYIENFIIDFQSFIATFNKIRILLLENTRFPI